MPYSIFTKKTLLRKMKVQLEHRLFNKMRNYCFKPRLQLKSHLKARARYFENFAQSNFLIAFAVETFH